MPSTNPLLPILIVCLLSSCGDEDQAPVAPAPDAPTTESPAVAPPVETEQAPTAIGQPTESAPAPTAPRAESAAAVNPTDPLATLTPAKADEFVWILECAKADPSKAAATLAMERGWSVGGWANLYMRVQAITQAGGYDTMLERMRHDYETVERRVAEQQGIVDAGGPGSMEARQTVAILQAQVASMRSQLAQADALRPGGELIDARLDRIRQAMGR